MSKDLQVSKESTLVDNFGNSVVDFGKLVSRMNRRFFSLVFTAYVSIHIRCPANTKGKKATGEPYFFALGSLNT